MFPLEKKNLKVIIILVSMLLSCSGDEGYDPFSTGLETGVLMLINHHRASIGLDQLVMEEVITYEARKHSIDMASGTVPFGHEGFSVRVAAIRQAFPSSSAAENVGWNSGDASSMVSLWLSSAGHKANIEGNYTRTGIGVARSADGSVYYTQIFIR